MPQQPISVERRQRIYAWCEEPKATRMSESGMRKHVRLTYARFIGVVKDWKADDSRQAMRVQIAQQKMRMDNPEVKFVLEDDPEFQSWSPLKREAFRLVWNVYTPNPTPQALHRLGQMTGWIIEKKEIAHTFDGADIGRELIKARRTLDEAGMAQVQPESSILSGKLRLRSGQGENKEG